VAPALAAAAVAVPFPSPALPLHEPRAAARAAPPPYPVIPADERGDLAEYSVVHTDRSLNLMSAPFQQVMRDLNDLLKATYNAHKVVIMPGSGTFGMEAVARQFATDEHVLVLRNGWFSYRWTEIFESGSIPASHTVLKARPVAAADPGSPHAQYAPCPVDEVAARIRAERPAVIFAPHVETSTGMILPDDYIKEVARAVREVGGLFVLDCIASGAIWADMEDLGVDVVISAPQKGWTAPAGAALVMLSERAAERMVKKPDGTSFSLSLSRWAAVTDAYVAGGFAYHTTVPTDVLRELHAVGAETLRIGLPELKAAQAALGTAARDLLASRGLTSVAAPGYAAPGVLVHYSPPGRDNPTMLRLFREREVQIAMGVPWRIDEPAGLHTFRLGLFGLDKMADIPKCVGTLRTALDAVLEEAGCDGPVNRAA